MPYHVPSTPVVSYSYVFGYNNRVGQVIVAGWLVLLALFGPPLRRGDAKGKPLTRSTLIKALAITGAFVLLLYLSTRELNGISESVYFNDRLRLLLEGHKPYRDFELAYGAGLIYLPAILVWVFHLPPGDAYGVVWIAAALIGVWLLYLTLRSVEDFPGSQRMVFLLFVAYGLTELASVGINYTLLRFVLPCWFGSVIHRLLFSGREIDARWALLLPLPCYVLQLLVSPELAVAFAIGILVYLLRFGQLRTGMHAVLFAAAVAGMGAVSWLALRLGVFGTLLAFRAGGYNFPLMPAPHLLLLFLLAAIAALYAGQQVRYRRPGVLVALIAVSAVSLAAALGRADQVHALMNPLGIVLAGFLLVSAYAWLWRAVLAVAWMLMFVLLLPMLLHDLPLDVAKTALPTFFAHEYRKNGSEQMTAADRYILGRISNAVGPAAGNEKFEERRFYATFLAARKPLDVPRIFGLPPGTMIYAPFRFLPDRSGVYHSRFVQEGYFAGVVNVTTPAEVTRKTDELLQKPRRPVLLPPDFEQNCGDADAGSVFYLRALFRYPYRARVVHPQNVLAPFCEALHANFHEVAPSIPKHFGYLLWMPDAQ